MKLIAIGVVTIGFLFLVILRPMAMVMLFSGGSPKFLGCALPP